VELPWLVCVENIVQSDDSTNDYESNHDYNSNRLTVATNERSSVSWADVVRKGVDATHSKERVVHSKNKNKVFRESILSKQSSE
jgi:hypothetical protein